MMNGILDSLFGKSQSWYDNVNKIQNQLAILQAGISAIGQDVWDQIYQTLQGSGATTPAFSQYSDVMSTLGLDQGMMLVTSSQTPTDGQIGTATSDIATYQPMLDYATQMAPELQAQVQSDQSQVQAMVSAAPLQSPAKVGVQVFEQTVADRAAALGQGLMDWTKYLAWGIGGVAVIYALSKMGGRRAA